MPLRDYPGQHNADGSTNVVTIGNGFLDTSNSSFVPLLADEVFTGVGINVLDYVEVIISVYSDVDSATDGLSIEYSAMTPPTATVPKTRTRKIWMKRAKRW